MITERKSVYSASNGTDRLKKGDVRERERDGRIFLGSREERTGGGKKECGGSRENMMHSARATWEVSGSHWLGTIHVRNRPR